jgi:hypothetical protein
VTGWMDIMQLVASDPSGDLIAADARHFFAPIAAVLIGIVALKFLFGENKSLAGFIGFLLLAIAVYALIWYGEDILASMGETVATWTGHGGDQGSIWILVAAGGAALVGAIALWFLRERSSGYTHQDTPVPEGDQSAESPLSHTEPLDYAECALSELKSFVLPNPTIADRLQSQIQLAIIVADEAGLFDQASPVTPQHVAKWQVLLDQWPDLAAELHTHPGLLRILEEATAEEFSRDPELFDFLGSGPRLHPVVRHVLYLTPTPDAVS